MKTQAQVAELALVVYEAAKRLNDATAEAVASGLRVEVESWEQHTATHWCPTPVLKVAVSQMIPDATLSDDDRNVRFRSVPLHPVQRSEDLGEDEDSREAWKRWRTGLPDIGFQREYWDDPSKER